LTRLPQMRLSLDRGIAFVALVLAALGPVVFDRYWVSYVLTGTFLIGIVAASMIFLSAYGGMVSLAQISIYGIAGFVLGNCVTTGSTKGLNLGLNPWLGVMFGIVIATAIGFAIGAISSRSTGIYFLMITLVFAVIANYFFGQVTTVSGFGGIGDIQDHVPSVIGNPNLHPNRLYYVTLVLAVMTYLLIRYVVRTPFGLTLQGIRDDAMRMTSLGYNVPLHRAVAFAFASFLASIAGVLFVWWNNQIAPGSIDLLAVLVLLEIGVIGGLGRVEGAWLGAFVFQVMFVYVQRVDFGWGVVNRHIGQARYNTAIGLFFLLIVLLSPGGLLGIWESSGEFVRRRLKGRWPAAAAAADDG
jgi:branched-chain amino acid transport system permease protein